MRIGILSDTHGVVPDAVPSLFRGVDAIIHAGDVGGEHVLEALRRIAPLTYVEGNVDDGAGHGIVRAVMGGLRLLVTHVLPRPHQPDRRVLRSLRDEPADVVIFGHSHLPHDEVIGGIRYFNPASCGPRRFDYPRSVGLLEMVGSEWTATHIPLDTRSSAALQTRMNQLSR